MVNIQQCTLCAFKQDALTAAARLIQQFPYRRHIGGDAIGNFQQFGFQGSAFKFRQLQPTANGVVMHQKIVNFCVQCVGIGQIGNTQRPTTDLIFIGRTDTALGGTDFHTRIGPLAGGIQFLV